MKALYIFPHPDDESFGPGAVMARQRKQGHEVHLLVLTRGGATKQRHRLGLSVEEMGAVRAKEMEEVLRVYGLAGMTILDFPDSGLARCDPRELEAAVTAQLERLLPEVVVTYPVHGISGFHDHLVTHAVVKRAWLEARERLPLPRLAFHTVSRETAEASPHFSLSHTPAEEIDVVVPVDGDDLATCRRALDCYVTFAETIERSGIKGLLPDRVPFELFGERFDPAAGDLFAGL
ncbi:MAG: PIG-L family deacetylase [Thermoanaerobaculia bacterium]|nr:PIG-L family deacetylase [Thermoanaerobaculia bacterium]